MSTIKVNNLEGLNGTIIVPQGHNLEAYGSMVVNGQLVVPRWTEATKPTSNLVIGLIGYNTELGVSEVYTGTETECVTVGKAVSKGLESSVGTLPFLHYQSEDLDSVPQGAMTGSTAWVNAGTAGNTYDLVKILEVIQELIHKLHLMDFQFLHWKPKWVHRGALSS